MDREAGWTGSGLGPAAVAVILLGASPAAGVRLRFATESRTERLKDTSVGQSSSST